MSDWIKDIEKWLGRIDHLDVGDRLKENDYRHWAYELLRIAAEQDEQNKRYREVVTQAISDLENECLWDALVKLKALEADEQ